MLLSYIRRLLCNLNINYSFVYFEPYSNRKRRFFPFPQNVFRDRLIGNLSSILYVQGYALTKIKFPKTKGPRQQKFFRVRETRIIVQGREYV